MTNYNSTGSLTAQIDELHKELSALKSERKVLFFIASCGISNAVLQFSLLAAVILIVVSFSFCFLEDIIKGE
jgi:Ni/Fe-hydrogenase subunit HybB-like protein